MSHLIFSGKGIYVIPREVESKLKKFKTQAQKIEIKTGRNSNNVESKISLKPLLRIFII